MFIEYLRDVLLGGTKSQRRSYYVYCFATFTTARWSEIVRAIKRDVDLERSPGIVRLTLLKVRGSKEYKYHNFQIHEKLKTLLRNHIDEHEHESLFTPDDAHLDGESFDEKEVRVKASWLDQHLKETLANTEFWLCSGWHIHRHSLIPLLGQTNDKDLVMSLVGHQTGMIHLRYKHASMPVKAGAFNSIALDVSEAKRGTQAVQNEEMADANGHQSS